MKLTRRDGEQTFRERVYDQVELLFGQVGEWRWSCDAHGESERVFDSRRRAMAHAVAHVANIHS